MKSLQAALELTERQKQIGICLLAGLSPKKIARQFKLSVSTVREHQAAIKKKLLCQNAYQTGSKLAGLFDADAESFKFYLKTLGFKGDHPYF